MPPIPPWQEEEMQWTRRDFLGLGAAGVAGLTAWGPSGTATELSPQERQMLDQVLAETEYLTPLDRFRMFGRGSPPPHELPPEKRRAVGLDRETWFLEVLADPESDCKLQSPLWREHGTALDWPGLMRLAEKHAVRFLKVMTCTNGPDPCGMGLWEGVPLREVIWLARPVANVRRVFYYGYHNDDPKQRFQSSLPIGRVLEDPPGELPVILCYKLNGQWLSPKAGGPVRLVVPDAYGNKSVKWLQRVVLTNSYQANDTYAQWNNDVESPLKTYARFVQFPRQLKVGQPAVVTGVAQVGPSGLAKVQCWLHPQTEPLPPDDPYLAAGKWQDAVLLGPPQRWGGHFEEGKLPPVPEQLDPAGRPRQWPLRYTLAHWAFVLKVAAPGRYDLRCRTIDGRGIAQPMPRPFPKSGANGIQRVEVVVEG